MPAAKKLPDHVSCGIMAVLGTKEEDKELDRCRYNAHQIACKAKKEEDGFSRQRKCTKVFNESTFKVIFFSINTIKLKRS